MTATPMLTKQPKVHEFIHFIKLLGETYPDLNPWLIRLNPQGKDPIPYVSWKSQDGLLTIRQAIDYMKHGGNIGIAATDHDNLVNMDCDGGIIQESEVKPTLMVRSRSRISRHAFYINVDKPKIPNIPTDGAGEVRTHWQFVVAAGSYVPVTDPKKLALIPKEDSENIGYYTVDNNLAPATIIYSEIPKVFRDIHEVVKLAPKRTPSTFNPKQTKGKISSLFDITAHDVCLREGGNTNSTERWPCLWHESDSGQNMSLSNEGLLQCWRDNRSFNGLQALVALSGYLSCREAGSGHKDSGGGASMVTGNDGAIFHAWKYAKEHGYIPKDDRIPVRALRYIA